MKYFEKKKIPIFLLEYLKNMLKHIFKGSEGIKKIY